MITLNHVPAHDWAGLAVGLAGLVLGFAQSKDRLPKWARQWLGRIGRDRIIEAIEYAERVADLTDAERRAEATAYLVRFSQKQLGFPVPESIANLLVEFVFQSWKRTNAKC
jgi:hypothetical protein